VDDSLLWPFDAVWQPEYFKKIITDVKHIWLVFFLGSVEQRGGVRST
jgi:hypothetical protein